MNSIFETGETKREEKLREEEESLVFEPFRVWECNDLDSQYNFKFIRIFSFLILFEIKFTDNFVL